jgi:hypothetical protein
MTGHASRRLCTSAALAVSLTVAFDAPTALAMDPGQCVDANAKAQGLRRSGKFGLAREQLHLCVQAECPAIIRDDCAQRLEELERLQPTIVFDARDGSGTRLVDVKVLMDGQPFAQKLDGTALPVDAGPHMFTFDVAGQSIVGSSIVVNEGEKARHEPVRIGPAAPSAPAPVVTPTPGGATTPIIVMAAPQEPKNVGGAQRAAGVTLGILGLLGIGAGAIFTEIESSDIATSKSYCGPTQCPNRAGAVAENNNANTALLGSEISFVAGGVLVVGGVILFLTAPSAHPPAAAVPSAPMPAVQVIPAVTPQAAGLTMLGRF